MKAYFLSISLHLLFAVLLFFLAASPGKALPPGKIDQVFLVSSVSVGAPFMAPAGPVEGNSRLYGAGSIRLRQDLPTETLVQVGYGGHVNRAPTIKPENTIGPVPTKPEISLSEKLAMRLSGAASEAWNHKTSNRNEGFREKSGTTAEAGTGIPAKEGLPFSQTQGWPGQVSVSTGEGTAWVESESGFSDGWYLALLSRRLTERWNPVREGIAVVSREVTVSFTITRDGRISDVGLARASGNPRFDRSGLTAVVESDFLPPLPANWGRKELQISVRFREK